MIGGEKDGDMYGHGIIGRLWRIGSRKTSMQGCGKTIVVGWDFLTRIG